MLESVRVHRVDSGGHNRWADTLTLILAGLQLGSAGSTLVFLLIQIRMRIRKRIRGFAEKTDGTADSQDLVKIVRPK